MQQIVRQSTPGNIATIKSLDTLLQETLQQIVRQSTPGNIASDLSTLSWEHCYNSIENLRLKTLLQIYRQLTSFFYNAIDEMLLETLLQYYGQLTYGCIDNQIPEIQEQVYILGYPSF